MRPSTLGVRTPAAICCLAADALHEEFIEAGADDREELHAFEQRRGVLGPVASRRLNASQVSQWFRYCSGLPRSGGTALLTAEWPGFWPDRQP